MSQRDRRMDIGARCDITRSRMAQTSPHGVNYDVRSAWRLYVVCPVGLPENECTVCEAFIRSTTCRVAITQHRDSAKRSHFQAPVVSNQCSLKQHQMLSDFSQSQGDFHVLCLAMSHDLSLCATGAEESPSVHAISTTTLTSESSGSVANSKIS